MCLARFCREDGIRHVDRTGIARLVEYSLEQTEDQEKISLELGDIKDLLQEANYYAGLDGEEFINGDHVEMAVEKGKKTRRKIKLGICGEHGGEPSSIEFCHRAGLHYVSCSPYRVPMARLAAAQANIMNKRSWKRQNK